MEYESKINIFGLKIILKFLQAQNYFFFHKNDQNCTFNNKNDLRFAWRDFNKTFCDVLCTYHKCNFKPQISPIFHFEYVNEV